MQLHLMAMIGSGLLAGKLVGISKLSDNQTNIGR